MHRFRAHEFLLGALFTVAVFAIALIVQAQVAGPPSADAKGWSWLFRDASGFFTACAVLVAVVQAFLFIRQLGYMRETINVAEKSASGLMKAERPHMVVGELKVSGLNSPSTAGLVLLSYVLQVQNYGRTTPAFPKEMILQFYFGKELPCGASYAPAQSISGVTIPGHWWGTQWPNSQPVNENLD